MSAEKETNAFMELHTNTNKTPDEDKIIKNWTIPEKNKGNCNNDNKKGRQQIQQEEITKNIIL